MNSTNVKYENNGSSENNLKSTAITCKVVIIGDSGVGKTSIISRYVKHTFTSDSLPTPGASFASKMMQFPEFDQVVKYDVNLELSIT
jgi:GTPase SAR1 family protein